MLSHIRGENIRRDPGHHTKVSLGSTFIKAEAERFHLTRETL